ncbi:MAG: bifunctional UDP-N-acetylglucosamine diphosphorylase/glucosamine-1-phosphate N-acetyltransferase GlmU [Burkholderiales bacterium]
MTQVVILAAGKGVRMNSETPKVLHRLAGKPLLEHVVQAALKLAPSKIVIVYGQESVREHFAGADLSFVLQEPQLGTGHAVQQAIPLLGRDGLTLLLYGDVPLIQPRTLQAMIQNERALMLLTLRMHNPYGYGRIVRDAEGKVKRIVEEKDATAAEREIKEVNTGILCASTRSLATWLDALSNNNAQREYYLTDVVALAAKAGVPIETAQPASDWEPLGVNDKNQLAQLERIYQLEHAKKLMTQGVTLTDPARIDVRGELICGRDVAIDVNCVFEGKIELADGVNIRANCIIKNAEIGTGAEILPNCVIEGAKIAAHCRVGPFSRIRPATVLDAEAHVGNFVEIKASRIGEKSKANHLSYVGDTEVGRNVNIGAGTITCNYDGANKHKTIIEDGVFIGSDTQLVAPVTVGKGATIGAGATITKNVPPEQLTLSRTPQVSIAGWKRPQKKSKQ